MKIKTKRGFTLIEILISLSIAIIIGGAFFSMVNAAIKNSAKNDKDIQSLSLINTVTEKVTNYIQETGKIGILGNNGFFEEYISDGKDSIKFYINKSNINDQLKFIKTESYVEDKNSFEIEVKKINQVEYDKGPFNKEKKYVYEIKVTVIPQGMSNKKQEITKSVYGPIE